MKTKILSGIFMSLILNSAVHAEDKSLIITKGKVASSVQDHWSVSSDDGKVLQSTQVIHGKKTTRQYEIPSEYSKILLNGRAVEVRQVNQRSRSSKLGKVGGTNKTFQDNPPPDCDATSCPSGQYCYDFYNSIMFCIPFTNICSAPIYYWVFTGCDYPDEEN